MRIVKVSRPRRRPGDELQRPAPALGSRGRAWAYRLTFHWLFAPVAVLFRLRVEGRDQLPVDGGYVLSANQWSNLDSWLVAAAARPRLVGFMGKAELFGPPFGLLFRLAGVFPVHRGAVDRDAAAEAVSRAQAGAVVGIFIEGTRRRKGLHKRSVAKPHDGPAWVALRAGVPLVPVAVNGTDRLLSLARWTVRVGAPVQLDDLEGLPSRDARRAATRRLWDAIEALEGP